jgi:hypothetical protein
MGQDHRSNYQIEGAKLVGVTYSKPKSKDPKADPQINAKAHGFTSMSRWSTSTVSPVSLRLAKTMAR